MSEPTKAWAWTGAKPDEVALVVGADAKAVLVFDTPEARDAYRDENTELRKALSKALLLADGLMVLGWKQWKKNARELLGGQP